MRIDFHDNPYGKLLSEVFTDVRTDTDGLVPGMEVEIYLRGSKLGTAEVMAVTACPFNRINDAMAYMSTGKAAHHLARVLKVRYGIADNDVDRRVINVVFMYKQRDILLHADLFMNHWKDIQQNHSSQIAEA